MPGPLHRVALFTGNYDYTRDGATQALNRLVGHLRGEVGAEVRIYSPTTQAKTPADLVAIPSVSFPGRPEYRVALGLTPAARRDFLKFRPQVVHLSTPDLLGFQAQKLARQVGMPLVASLHTRFETYFAYYGLGWLEPLVQQAQRNFYQRCDRVMVPSSGLVKEIAVDALAGRVRIWSRGVDRELFSPQRRDLDWRRSHGFSDDEVVVLFFGRVVLEKGLPTFVEAIDRLRRTHRKLRVLVVGEGPARPWLQEQLPEAVFTGALAGEALARAVASADILLNPSATEAFSNVTLEAMASGLAVVSAHSPVSHSLIRHLSTGLLCPASDPQAHITAVDALVRDEDLRRTLGRAACEASADYSWAAALRSVVRTYEEAIAEHAAQPERAAA